ncbi:hypothetical protein SCLCIDRAFT_670935 [Scleroderma citrinum Foug A]|uniref:Uncharacterized protein n=1 Tax=Scleroderma citrinum Foug A TaxID=1036808 RepID=A0A0C3DTC5_9AGAM|nr:hypothetical protein SCLCIDRAFT_670935 [Scleroderma citrinum Foug A]
MLEKRVISGALCIQDCPKMLRRRGLVVGVEATDILIPMEPKMNWAGTAFLLGGILLHRRQSNWSQRWGHWLRCCQE